MSKSKQFFAAIHHSLAMSVVGESHQYVTKLVLRARRNEFYQGDHGQQNSDYTLSAFLSMHVAKPDREKGTEMFQSALAAWEPGKRIALSVIYRNNEPGMVDPIIDSIQILPDNQ